MQYRVRFVLIASILFVGAPALAKGKAAKGAKSATPEAFEAKEREARKACLEGDYAKGVAILSDLFLDSKSPTYIFNQGRCYEQSERYQEAIGRFREYLRMPGSEDEALAQKHIAECEALDAKRNPPVVAVPVVAQPAAQPAPAVSATNAPPEGVVVRPQQQSSSSGSGLRVAGVVLAGVGVAALATGIVLNVKANSLATSIEPPHAYDRSKESTRQSYETFGWVGYGIGAAAIVTGGVLYGVGWSKGSNDSVALVPAIGPRLAGAALRGAF
jgi:tetratricopeptide (TPR) repeat protein